MVALSEYAYGAEDLCDLDGVYASFGGFFVDFAKYTLDNPDGDVAGPTHDMVCPHEWASHAQRSPWVAKMRASPKRLCWRLALDMYLGTTWANDTYPGVYVESTTLFQCCIRRPKD